MIYVSCLSTLCLGTPTITFAISVIAKPWRRLDNYHSAISRIAAKTLNTLSYPQTFFPTKVTIEESVGPTERLDDQVRALTKEWVESPPTRIPLWRRWDWQNSPKGSCSDVYGGGCGCCCLHMRGHSRHTVDSDVFSLKILLLKKKAFKFFPFILENILDLRWH